MKKICILFVLVSFAVFFNGFTAFGELIFEDDFMGENVSGIDPLNWQWWLNSDIIFVSEADDVPEYGPGVLTIGNGTAHIGLENEATKNLVDYRVTVLWVDRLIDGETDDADFHIGIRCAEYDAETQFPESCYEIEVDGDDNDSANVVPEDGPTSFHLFIRGGAAAVDNNGNALAHATRDIVPRPIANVWYWTSIQIQGFVFQGKQWRYSAEEPDWQLEGEDLDKQFPSGGIRVGVWSGMAEIAYVRVETIEPTSVSDWSLY